MKCTNCGYESDLAYDVCPVCNSRVTPTLNPEAPVSPLAARLKGLFNDTLFLVVCILMTVSVGIGVLNTNFDVIKILYTVFLWLCYVNCRGDIIESRYIRNISGTVYASYVITNVAIGIIAVCGIIVGALMPVVAANIEFMDTLKGELSAQLGSYADWIVPLIASSGILLIIVAVVACGIGFVINFLGRRVIHRFIKAQYVALDCATENNADLGAAKGWLMAFGILSAVGALSSIGDFAALLANGSYAAALIIGSVLIGRHYSANN